MLDRIARLARRALGAVIAGLRIATGRPRHARPAYVPVRDHVEHAV